MNLERNIDKLREPVDPGIDLAPRPTAKQLERHGERYGWGGVAEVATMYGLRVNVPRVRRERKVRGHSAKEIVAQMLKDDHSPEAIAEALNTSPSRARRLIAEVRDS